jgi:hypothetical protein
MAIFVLCCRDEESVVEAGSERPSLKETSMKTSYLIAVLALAVILMTSLGIGGRNLSESQRTDYNVPGSTTGKGRSSLME